MRFRRSHALLASFHTTKFDTKLVKTNSMLKLLLTLAAVIAIAAAVPSGTQGLEFQDLQDSDTDDLFADVSNELDVADELDLDDEVAESSLSSSSGSPVGDALPTSTTRNSKTKKTQTTDDDDAKSKQTKKCCPAGSYGPPGGLCTLCPTNHMSDSTTNGITDAKGKCPNESSGTCRACDSCQIVVGGKCVSRCSAKTKCKTTGPTAGQCS